MTWRRHLVQPLPDHIGDAEASALEALGIGLDALELGAVEPTSRVAVIGCGPIGLLVILALRAAGVTDILAAEPLPHRAAAAVRPAPDCWTTRRPRPIPSASWTSSSSAQATTPRSPGPHGSPGRVASSSWSGSPMATRRRSRRRWLGARASPSCMCHRMRPGHLERAIELVGGGAIDVVPLITHRYPLDEVDRAFEALVDRRGLKVVVLPNPGR